MRIGFADAQGGLGGGWELSVDDGKLSYTSNFVGLHTTHITATEALTTGAHQVRAEFAYDGGGLGKGAQITLFEDGRQLATGHIDATHPILFSADETADVGFDAGSQVSDRYSDSDSRFTGTSNGCRSTWAMTATTTSSHPKTGSGWPWPGSRMSTAPRPAPDRL